MLVQQNLKLAKMIYGSFCSIENIEVDPDKDQINNVR